MTRLVGRVAIISGAGNGIGRGIALAMAREGARIVGLDIDMPAAEAMADDVKALGGEAVARLVDVADGDLLRAAVDETVERFGRLDILVNNAAEQRPEVMGLDTDVVDTPVEVWDRSMNVNLRGPMLASKFSIPHMLASTGKGVIINISSTAADAGDVVMMSYSASKAAMHALTRSIATSHGPRGIRCNAIASGLVLTEAAQRHVPQASLDVWRRHRLVKEPGRPEDVAELAVYLASDASRYITGQAITIDGGAGSVHQPWYADSRILHPTVVPADFDG